MKIRITVEYFAALREERGQEKETIETSAVSPRELYKELQERHGFSLKESVLRPAVNQEMAEWDQALAAGDHVVFIPPVAGG